VDTGGEQDACQSNGRRSDHERRRIKAGMPLKTRTTLPSGKIFDSDSYKNGTAYLLQSTLQRLKNGACIWAVEGDE
jgi:hypothetical protein